MDFIADNQSGTLNIPQLKILVVDDDALNQRMMQLLLTREGHLVDLASDGLEAFNAIQVQKYDVVFMDLQMPVMDGIESSRQIRKWENGGQHTFIVALTASYLPEQGHVLFDAGIDNYISKPFEIEQIQRLLKYAFQDHLSDAPYQLLFPEQELRPEKVLDIQKGIVQVGGDETTYKELLRDFVEGLPRRLRNLQQFYKNKELVELSRTAHNLSGIAANLGASQLSACAKTLNKQSVEGYAELELLIQEIHLVVDNLLEVSKNFLIEEQISV